jgi:hypothetical protein
LPRGKNGKKMGLDLVVEGVRDLFRGKVSLLNQYPHKEISPHLHIMARLSLFWSLVMLNKSLPQVRWARSRRIIGLEDPRASISPPLMLYPSVMQRSSIWGLLFSLKAP